MGIASAVTGGINTGLSLYQTIKAGKDKRDAINALNNLPVPELSNVAKNLQVSTLGADLRKEEAGRSLATQIDALQGAGTRGIIGGIGMASSRNDLINRDIGANLDEQQKAIDQMQAQDNIRIQQTNEQRHNQDVAGLSSQINSAQNSQQQGIANTISSLSMAGQGFNKPAPTDTSTLTGSSLYPNISPPPNVNYGNQVDYVNPYKNRFRINGIGGYGAYQPQSMYA